MSKVSLKKDKKILRVEEISTGILDENNDLILGIGIPGRGKVNIKISFEKERDKINLTL